MAPLPRARAQPLPGSSAMPGPALIPCLMLRHGQVCRPGPDGPVVARTRSGSAVDPFDAVDRLSSQYALLYLVDLDGIERGTPQLDYEQELARDMPLWVDAGVRAADQAIDVIVAGAQRAVLSSAYLRSPRQLERAWRLSTQLIFEIELRGATLASPRADWGTDSPGELARKVRAAGPDHVILSPREVDPDWTVVREVAAGGPTWVDGSFAPADAPRLGESGASGGIFHIDELLDRWEA